MIGSNVFTQANLDRYLGSGVSSDVYLLQSNDRKTKYALKIFKSDMFELYEAEMRALSALKSAGVPNILYPISHSNQDDINSHRYFIAMPVGYPLLSSDVNDAYAGTLSVLENFHKLVPTVVKAFDAGFAHGDIRLTNIVMDNDDEIRLIDWGCSEDPTTEQCRSAYDSASDAILISVYNAVPHQLTLSDQLESLVKCWILFQYYRLGRKPMYRIEIGTNETAKEMLDFWKKDSLFQAIQSFLGTDFSADVSKLENFLRTNSTYDVRVPEF